MLVSTLSKVTITGRWDEYLARFPADRKDIYFTEGYVRLYENSNDKAECFVYQEKDKVYLFPYLKRRIRILEEESYDFETPYGYGGPICNCDDIDFSKRAFKAFRETCHDSRIIAGLIKFHPLIQNQRLTDKGCITVFNRQTVAVDLSLEKEVLWAVHFQPANKRAIKKAEHAGLIFNIDERLESIDIFKKMYHETMDKVRAGSFYYFDDDYFHNVRGLSDGIFLATVSNDAQIISGALFFKFGHYAHYHLGASREEFLDFRPNNLLFYKTILKLKDSGCRWLHLGGGTTAEEQNSLFKFKKTFSKNLLDFYIGEVIVDERKYQDVSFIWSEKYPEKKKRYGHFVLKHRF